MLLGNGATRGAKDAQTGWVLRAAPEKRKMVER